MTHPRQTSEMVLTSFGMVKEFGKFKLLYYEEIAYLGFNPWGSHSSPENILQLSLSPPLILDKLLECYQISEQQREQAILNFSAEEQTYLGSKSGASRSSSFPFTPLPFYHSTRFLPILEIN